MATYTVVNGTEAQLTNVDGSGTKVDALTYKDGITLTNTQLATLASTPGVNVTSDLTAVADAQQLKRVQSIAAQYLST